MSTRSSRPASRTTRRLSGPYRRRAALREASYLCGLLTAAGALYGVTVLLPSRLKTERLRVGRDQLQTEVAEIKERTQKLRSEAEGLSQDSWVVERALRARLGYLRGGERVFR